MNFWNRILPTLLLTIALCAPATATAQTLSQQEIQKRAAAYQPLVAGTLFKVAAQNAGITLYETPEYSLHIPANYLPFDIANSGPPYCQVGENGRAGSTFVAIKKSGPDEPIEREWIWNSIRPPIVNEIIPAICPNAVAVVVSVYAEGYDILEDGTVQDIRNIKFPNLLVPRIAQSDIDPDWGTIEPHRTVMNEIAKIVSGGIVRATFVLDPTVQSMHSECDNCEFEFFAPHYFSWHLTPGEPFTVVEMRSRLDGRPQAEHLNDLYSEQIEPGSSFNRYAAYRQKVHKETLTIRAAREERLKQLARIQALREFIDNNFYELLIAGLLSGPKNLCPSHDPQCRTLIDQDAAALALIP